jgi:16S rRNA processing protein RimM
VAGAHGLQGELKVDILTEDPHRFALLEHVFLGLEDQEPVPWRLTGYRLHKGRALLRVEGVANREAAAAMRGYLVQVPIEHAIPLKEDEYYEHQILGLDVESDAGESLGKVVEVLYTGANEVYIVRADDGRELLIPAIESVVREVNLEEGCMVVHLMEGLR